MHLDVDETLRWLAPRLGDQLLEQPGADAAPAEGGRERDVHDPDVLLAAVHVEPPGGLAVDLDHVERRPRVVLR